MANGNSIYSPQPASGLDTFSDKLVGHQFTDGTSQFTLGNFGISMSITDKQNTEFSIGNFSKPITLSTLDINEDTVAKELNTNSFKAFVNFDRHTITNFTLYGSLNERLKVATQNIIKNFPAALVLTQLRRDYLTGQTATNIVFDSFDDETTLDINVNQIRNPFAIEYTSMGNLFFTGTTQGVTELRNLTRYYTDYSLFIGNREFKILELTPAISNTSGVLSINVDGNPFSGVNSTTLDIIIRPNTLKTEEIFDSFEDVEKMLLERKSNPIYTATFNTLRETNTGKLIKSTKNVTWPLLDKWNILIDGFTFTNYLLSLSDIAETFDTYKTNIISRFLTTGALKEFDTQDKGFEKVLQIYGRSFDSIKKYIDGLAYMTNVTYDKVNNVPDILLKNLAHLVGWGTPSSIDRVNIMDALFTRGGKKEFAGVPTNDTPTELDMELYRKILVNTAYLFKSKGTRKSIEFLLRLIGAPEGLIEFNEHVYVAGNRINMGKFNQKLKSFSGGTYTEEVPVKDQYFVSSPPVVAFPPVIITGYTYALEKVTKKVSVVNRNQYPVGIDGYPKVPKFSKDGYFQAGAGWFERTPQHKSERVVNAAKSVFTGNTPVITTQFSPFTYGEKYLDYLRKFPDMDEGFNLNKIVDNKKSWVVSDTRQQDESFKNLHNRKSILNTRGTSYYVDADKQVLNVKNVDLFLNIGQGLTWDVWKTSNQFGCIYGLKPLHNLSNLYPSPGGPDWTTIQIDASQMSFFEFADNFWKVHLNVKNRQTIDDGHGGGYPTLMMVYLDYLDSVNFCGVKTNEYTYEKMLTFVDNIGDYWIRLVEQMVPATTLWRGGIKIENSAFHRYKYAYKHEPVCDDLPCLGSWVECIGPRFEEVLVNGFLSCNSVVFSGASWSNRITLNGENYRGNIYYSSTTINDIPTTDLWLNNMVQILSGITGQCFNYYIFDDTTTGIPSIDNPRTIILQGCCEGGVDMWGPNGPNPGTFQTDVCLVYDVVRATITAKTANFYSFYDTTSTPGDAMFAAKAGIEAYAEQLRLTGWSGKTYHIPTRGLNSDERWLTWSRYPWDGHNMNIDFRAPDTCYNGNWYRTGPSGIQMGTPQGTVPETYVGGPIWNLGPARGYCDPDNGGFAVFPTGSTIPTNNNSVATHSVSSGGFAGGDKNAIVISIIDESEGSYYFAPNGLGQGYGGLYGMASATNYDLQPPMGRSTGVDSDWNRTGVAQPTGTYQTDFAAFMAIYNNYTYFKNLVYPIVSSNVPSVLTMPLHVYGALETGWCQGCIKTNWSGDTCVYHADPTLTGYTSFNEWSVQINYTGNTVCQFTNRPTDSSPAGCPHITGFTAYTYFIPCVSEFVDNGTVLAAGGTLSAITVSNPYVSQTGTNIATGYVGPGLKNFGFGHKSDLGVPFSCTEGIKEERWCSAANSDCYTYCPSRFYMQTLGCDSPPHVDYNSNFIPAYRPPAPPAWRGGLYLGVNPNSWFTQGTFTRDLSKFLGSKLELFPKDCTYCTPICSQTCEPGNYNSWVPSWAYSLGDMVEYRGDCYRSLITGNTVTPSVGFIESYTGNSVCGPYTGTGYTQTWELSSLLPLNFDGGNNFIPRADCTDLIIIPDNPIGTGDTYTTNPIIFKEGIANIGGQDCFESYYMVGDDFIDECACDFTVDFINTVYTGSDAFGVDYQLSVLPGTLNPMSFTLGDKVCCGVGTLHEGKSFMLREEYTIWDGSCSACTYDILACTTSERFNWSICDMEYRPDNGLLVENFGWRCWAACTPKLLDETSGRPWIPSVITNDPYPWIGLRSGPDSTNLGMSRLVAPGNLNKCICNNIKYKSIIYDAINGAISKFPQEILDFKIEGTVGIENAIPWSSVSLNSQNLKKLENDTIGKVFPCCIANRVEIINHRYRGIKNNKKYLGMRKWIVDIDELTHFYLYNTKTENTERCFLKIPKDFITFNTINSTLEDPTGDFINSMTSTNTDIVLELAPSPNGGFYGLNSMKGQVGPTYISTPTYWGDSKTGRMMNCKDMEMVFTDSILKGNPDDSYQLEFNFICESIPSGAIEFMDNIVKHGGGNISADDIPEGQPCPSNLLAPVINMAPRDGENLDINDDISSFMGSSLIQTLGEGGVITFDYQKYFNKYHPSVDTNNYEIVGGRIFTALNTPIYKGALQIPYNLTSLSVIVDRENHVAVRTFTTYNDGTDYPKAKLTWMSNIISNWPNNTTQLKFRTDQVKDSFEFSLTSKQIGNVESYNLYNPTYITNYYNGNTLRTSSVVRKLPSRGKELNFTLSGVTVGTWDIQNAGTVLPVMYKNLNDWIKRSIGNNPFTNSYAVYNPNNSFKLFEIRKDFSSYIGTEKSVSLTTPLSNLNVEIVGTTYGDWNTFKNASPPLSGLTSQYTGYTDLSIYNTGSTVISGFTNNLNNDLVFDLNYNYSAFTGTTVIPMNGTRVVGATLKGAGSSLTSAAIKPSALSENGGPVNFVTSAATDYLYYKVKSNSNHRLQYIATLNVEYYDTQWCNYLRNNYKVPTNYTYPANDLHYKELVNNSILYCGGGTDITTLEGYVANPNTNIAPFWSVTPGYGFNPDFGLKDFEATISIQRTFSASTTLSATTLAKQIIGKNIETYPNANNWLTLPVTAGDMWSDSYDISGNTCGAVSGLVFTRQIDIILDTKCTSLAKGDIIRLKNSVNWTTSSKMSGSTYLKVNLGTQRNGTTTRYPWYRITVDTCNTPRRLHDLLYDTEQYSHENRWFNNNEHMVGKEKGTLYVLPSYGEGQKLIVPPPLKITRDLNALTYLDVPTSYIGQFGLQLSKTKTANWNASLTNGNFTNASQPAGKAPFTHEKMKTYWTMPYFTPNLGLAPKFPNPAHTYLVETEFRVKGTSTVFSHVVYYNDDIETTMNYYNNTVPFTNGVLPLIGRDSIIQNEVQSERKMYFSLTNLIINGEVSRIVSTEYDPRTPIHQEIVQSYVCSCRQQQYGKVIAETNLDCSMSSSCQEKCNKFCVSTRPNLKLIASLSSLNINKNTANRKYGGGSKN